MSAKRFAAQAAHDDRKPARTVLVALLGAAVLFALSIQGAAPLAAAPGIRDVPTSGGPLPAAPMADPSTVALVGYVPGSPSVYGQQVQFLYGIVGSAGCVPNSGTIDLLEGVSVVTSAAVPGALFTSALSVGAHTLTLRYNGNGTCDPDTSPAFAFTVNKADTTTTVSSAPNPSEVKQSVTFTATVSPVAPGAGTRTGTVTFKAGGAPIGTGAVNGAGQATISTTALPVGVLGITAEYGGDGHFNSSTSAVLTHTVLRASTTTTLTSSQNPSVFGQSVTFQATVTSAAGTPSGSVTFDDGVTVLATRSLDGAGQASFTTSLLVAGIHPIKAVYHGDADFAPSTSNLVNQVVNKASTSVALTRSTNVAFPVNPSKFGQFVTFTASLSAVAPGAGTPTGFVLFLDDGAAIGVGFIDGAGVASFTTSALEVGAHPMTAVYGGDLNFGPIASALLTQTVSKADTTVVLTTSITPSKFGQLVTFRAAVAVTPPGGGTAFGSVEFRDGATTISTVALDPDGFATFSTGALAVGVHNMTAVYIGSIGYNTSTSPNVPQTVDKADTTITVTSNPSPSFTTVYGEPIQLQAQVSVTAPGAGTPTGKVTFKEGANTLGQGMLDGAGGSTFIVTPDIALAPGSYSITAVYVGDASFNTSTSGPHTHTVNKSNSTTDLVSGLEPAVYGQEIIFTANVAPDSPGSGSPSGTVTFGLGPLPAVAESVDTASGLAQTSTSALPVGTHTITASYGGDTKFNTSSDSLTQTVNKANTTTTLTSSDNPTVFGQSTTFTAQVKTVLPGTGTPDGTVVFKDGGTTIATELLDLSGVATFSTALLTVGAHTITAEYGGGTNFNTSTSLPLTQTVNKAATTTTLASSLNPSVVGQLVTFTANVAVVAPGGGVPGGTVKFRRAGADMAGCAAVPLVAGQATCATSALPVGPNPITAVYSGTGDHATSSSAVLYQQVDGAGAAVTVTSAPNPSLFGQPVTFTASVTAVPPAVGTPTGQVTFKSDGINFGQATLVAGVATFNTASLPAGTHAITAVYGGDANFSISTSAPHSHTVNPANTTTTVTSSANPSVFGQSVTFNASVTAVAPGAGLPTGTVTFKDGVTTIGMGLLNGSGQASFTATALAAGAHAITAEYGGDASFNASTGALPTQTVNKANTTTTVTGVPSPSLIGTAVTFTAQVAAQAPGAGTPTGTVTFKDGAAPIVGCVAVALDGAGQAACSTSALALGAHTINAEYGGDGNFNASTGSMAHLVSDTPVDLSVSKTSTPNPVQAGADLTYAITATNPSTLGTTVTLDDPLPTEVTFVSLAVPAGWICTVPAVGSSGTVSCSAFMAASSSAVFTLVVHVPLELPAGTILANTAEVAGGQPDPNPDNNRSTNETTVYRTRRP